MADYAVTSEASRARLCAEAIVEQVRALGLSFGLDPDGAVTVLSLAYIIALAQSAGPLAGEAQRDRIVRIAQRMLGASFEQTWQAYVCPPLEAVH